jgi:hypothetical protein
MPRHGKDQQQRNRMDFGQGHAKIAFIAANRSRNE